MVNLILDSSVMIATMKPGEAGHGDALGFVGRLRAAAAAGQAAAFAPPELWLEVYVAEQRLLASRRQGPPPVNPLATLAVELIAPADQAALAEFFALLTRQMRGRRPFANATDLVYLWAAHHADGAVVTLDEGLLKYHGVVCDVTRPQHVVFGR